MDISWEYTRPVKRFHNELENHHAIFMGKSTISMGHGFNGKL
jgi:hypothetical protein